MYLILVLRKKKLGNDDLYWTSKLKTTELYCTEFSFKSGSRCHVLLNLMQWFISITLEGAHEQHLRITIWQNVVSNQMFMKMFVSTFFSMFVLMFIYMSVLRFFSMFVLKFVLFIAFPGGFATVLWMFFEQNIWTLSESRDVWLLGSGTPVITTRVCRGAAFVTVAGTQSSCPARADGWFIFSPPGRQMGKQVPRLHCLMEAKMTRWMYPMMSHSQALDWQLWCGPAPFEMRVCHFVAHLMCTLRQGNSWEPGCQGKPHAYVAFLSSARSCTTIFNHGTRVMEVATGLQMGGTKPMWHEIRCWEYNANARCFSIK